MRKCLEAGCGGSHLARGYCSFHYYQKKNSGHFDDLRVHMQGPDTVRFWAKVEKAGPDECWHWKIKKGLNQYGQFRSSELGIPLGAHRFSFFLANGFLPIETMHTCDVRSCVNPRHLVAGTRALNMADMKAKGRAPDYNKPRGEAHHGAKLTEEDVRAIRASDENYHALGRRYGVTHSTAKAVKLRKTWTHIT